MSAEKQHSEQTDSMSMHIETLQQRAVLLGERLDRIKQHVTSAYPTDLDDQALERENDEVLDQLAIKNQRELSLIRNALQRYEKGEYGLCLRCHQPINGARLNPIPEAEYCINCLA